MSNELLREVWKEMVFPLMDKYIQDLWTKRTETNNWPERSVFSDLCKPFQVKDKKTQELCIQLLCIVPSTPSFWSAILAMYVLFGRETFRNHQRTCCILLDEINKAKFHVNNLTNHFHIVKWLQECADGYRGKVRNERNLFLVEPVVCVSFIQSDLMVVQGTKKADECMQIDQKLVDHFQEQYDKISKRVESQDDRQGQGDNKHELEGVGGSRAGDGDGDMGGAPDGDAQDRPNELHIVALPDLRADDPDPADGERAPGVAGGHERVGSDGRDRLYCSSIQTEDSLEEC